MSLITSSNNSEHRLTYCGENCEAEKTGLDEIPVNRVGLQRETVRYRSETMKEELITTLTISGLPALLTMSIPA